MSRIIDYQRAWRTVIVLLLLVSSVGPWVFDRINVPMQYECTNSVRLYQDFCGIPVSGLQIFSSGFSGIINSAGRLISGDPEVFQETSEITGLIILLVLILPIVSMVVIIITADARPGSWFNMTAIAGGLVMGMLIALLRTTSASWHLWGIWLYIGVLFGALLMESIRFRKRFRGQRAVLG